MAIFIETCRRCSADWSRIWFDQFVHFNILTGVQVVAEREVYNMHKNAMTATKENKTWVSRCRTERRCDDIISPQRNVIFRLRLCCVLQCLCTYRQRGLCKLQRTWTFWYWMHPFMDLAKVCSVFFLFSWTGRGIYIRQYYLVTFKLRIILVKKEIKLMVNVTCICEYI